MASNPTPPPALVQDVPDIPMGDGQGPQQQPTNKRPRLELEREEQATVRRTPPSPERNVLRKEPNRQNLWEKEEQNMSWPIPPPVSPPSDDWSSFPYLPELDPAIYTGVPSCRKANPHFCMSRSGATPPLPLLPHPPFPEGPFQVPPIPAAEFRGNLSVEQITALDDILAKQPNTILALIPHGAGKVTNVNAPAIVKDCQDFLKALAFEENDRKSYNVQIHPPDVRNRGGPKSNPFGRPWTFLLRLPSNAKPLRDFLLWQRIFAVSKTASFTVYELDSSECTWDIFPIVGMAVENCLSHADVLDQKATILSTIKGDLQRNPDYCRFAGKTGYVNLGHKGDLNEILRTLADTFHLERTEAENDRGVLVPAYVLMARPPSQNAMDYATWRSFFVKNERGQLRESFRGALQHFDIGVLPVRIWCELCKSRIHCTARCPLPNVEGWNGITPRDLGVRVTAMAPYTYAGPPGAITTCDLISNFRRSYKVYGASPTRGRGRGGAQRGSTGGGRGGRGRGRGGGSA